MHRVYRRLLAAPLAVLAASCADPHSPTAPPVIEGPSFSMVEEYGTGGLPGFAFLPPLAYDETTGAFDDGLLDLLAVEICEWVDGACASVVRTITAGSAFPARLRLDDGEPAYLAMWQTRDDGLDPDADYRIRVLASGSVLGWADVEVLAKGAPASGDGRVTVENGATLPIRFWIPVGLGERAGADGGTIELADGRVTLDLPPGALPEDVLITAVPTELPPDAPPFVGGTAWDFGPDGLVFDEPVTLTIGYDPANLPPGTEESELRIHKLVDGTFVQQDAGTIDVVNHTASALVNGFSVFVLLERLFPGSPEDLNGPEVQAIEVLDAGSGTYGSSTTIDVSGGDRTVDVRLDLTDDISGVQSLGVTWVSPGGGVFLSPCTVNVFVTVPPDTGNDTNGSWSCPAIWPQFSEAGDWTVRFIQARDKVGNFRNYFDFGVDGLCDTSNRTDCIGAPPEVSVVSVPEDVTAPSALSLEVSLNTQPRAYASSINVDVSSSGVGVVFGLRATDDLSGLGSEPNLGRPTFFYGVSFQGPSNQGFGWFCQSTPVTGTSLDGLFECFSSLPQAAEEGTWRVTNLNLSDRAGNTDFYNDNGAGELCNQAGDCIAQPTVEVGGMGDAEPPTLESYALSVTDDEVTITMDLTDPGSGVSFVRVSYRSQVANQFQFCDASLTAGTRENGTWSCTITFSEFAARGEWQPSVFVRDLAFNTRDYQRGAADGILCYTEDGAETCQDYGETDVILQ